MERIEYIPGFDVRLGTLKKTKDGCRQKGVDTLIAIDMLSKAYENHYDMAVLVAGDEDFLEVVKSVKNTGKRVIGVFFRSHISENLMNSFDRCFIINKEWIQRFAMYTVKNSKTIEDFLVSMFISAKQDILVSTYLIDPFSYFNKTNFLPIFINAGNNYISIKILLNKKNNKLHTLLSKALNQLANKTTKKPVDIEIRFHDTYIENRSSGIIADKNRLFLIKHDTNAIEAIQSDKSDVVLQYLNRFNKLWEEASSQKK